MMAKQINMFLQLPIVMISEIYTFHVDYHILIVCFFGSAKGRLLVLCIDHVQNSDSGSMTFCSKAGSSSQKTSPFNEIVGNVPELLSCSSLGSSPDDNSSDGIKLDENEIWQFRLVSATTWPGIVHAICPYLDRYFLASAGNAVSCKALAFFHSYFLTIPSFLNFLSPHKKVLYLHLAIVISFIYFLLIQFYVCGFPNDTPQKVRKYAVARTRFAIRSLTAYFSRIAVGDNRDGILFFSYHEVSGGCLSCIIQILTIN
jgi:splicing factor 3B subunit 3